MSEVTHVDHHNFEIRLDLKPGVAPGEIRFSDLHRLCDTLQELNTRISRLVISQAGPGRTADPAARVAELRLVAVRSGSTRLGVGFGDLNTLPAPEFSLVEDECYSKFREIMQSIPEQICPSWITPLIAESAIQVVEAFDRAAFGALSAVQQEPRAFLDPRCLIRPRQRIEIRRRCCAVVDPVPQQLAAVDDVDRQPVLLVLIREIAP